MNVISAIVCFAAFLHSTSLVASELAFGDPAPRFSAAAVRGKQITAFERGRIYVVEFGGTTCVPCIKFIPHMNELQKRHEKDVSFVSVFMQDAELVQTFLEGPGRGMRVSVAIDESGLMKTEWLDAAGLQGIPQAFIVDRAGKLAWFGYPRETNFAETLKGVVEDTYDPRLEFARMELTRKREEASRSELIWVDKINTLRGRAYACKTPEEAITVIDAAVPEFAASPERITLSILKLEFLQKVPKSGERAYQLALSLAVEAVNDRNPNYYIYACEAMLSRSEYALTQNRNPRMADLALAVLLDDEAPTNHVHHHPDGLIDYKINRLAAIANARRIRGESTLALKTLTEAVSIQEGRDRQGKPDWWLKDQESKLSNLKSKLDEWKKSTAGN